MGTSITAGIHAPRAYLTPVIVGSRLNLKPINAGFDGACAGAYDRHTYDQFSLCRLADAIASGDWSAQDKSIASMAIGNEASLLKIETVDFNTVTHIGLEYGTNDFTVCAPLATFKEALTYSIQKISSSFPQARLFLMTPAWRLNFQNLDCDSHPNESGIFLKEYVDAMIEVAVLTHVPCLDMWRTLGLNTNNYKSFTADSLHPNEAGARRRGEAIAAFMNSVF
jgi:lysophospholipase L1-like esterase